MNTPRLTRRTFITVAGTGAVWLTTGCRGDDPGAAPTTSPLAASPSTSPVTSAPIATSPTTTVPVTSAPVTTAVPAATVSDRVLVLVQLLGGNDGLNTLVPLDGRYRDARPTIAVADGGLLPLAGLDGYGLHPGLASLAPLWDAGALAIAAGVGFDGQTRSHFDSRDVWWRAGAPAGADGWLARWLEAAAVDRPDDPLEALALGAGPRALAGSAASAVTDPADTALRIPAGVDAATYETFLLATSQASPGESPTQAAARTAAVAALSTSKVLAEVVEPAGGEPTDGGTPDLAVQLSTAAALISARPGLRIVTVGIEGFDTHAGQPDVHAALLTTLAESVSGFWSALGPDDRARTMLLTTSEFGRRVAQNGSLGTDHGRAGVQFVLGGGVRGGQLIGAHDLAGIQDGDLPITVPADDVFADALRWLGGPVDEVLGTDPPATGLLA